MTEKIVQLVDKDNNNLYPVAGSLKQGSVTTSTINGKAVTADKIDFSTLGAQCVGKHGTGGTISVSFTPATSGGIIEVDAITGYVWGYAGGTASMRISNSGGLNTDSYIDGALSGGDLVGRQMHSKYLYSGATAGTTYTITATIYGQLGTPPSIAIFVKYYPGSNG